jgi:hypothetical protein
VKKRGQSDAAFQGNISVYWINESKRKPATSKPASPVLPRMRYSGSLRASARLTRWIGESAAPSS